MGQTSSRFATDDPELIKLLESVMGNKSAANLFWACLLGDGAPSFEFPSSDTNECSTLHDDFGRILPHDLIVQLDGFCGGLGISRFAALIAAFAVLLERYGDTSEFIIHHNYGVTGSSHRVLKYPVTKVNLHSDESSTTFSDLCAAQHQLIQRSSYHLCIPTLPLDNESDLDRFLGVFLLDSGSGHTREGVLEGTAMCKLSLVVELLESGCILVRLNYDTSAIDLHAAQALYDQFLYVLEQCLVSAHISDVRCIPTVPNEQARLLLDQSVFANGHNTTTNSIDFAELDLTLDSLICRQAQLTPDRIAVQQFHPIQHSLTYAQLVASALQLKARLVRRFNLLTDSNQHIGIILNRGTSQVIAVLAVLMCGCAYVPIDPVNHPPDRIDYILRDANAVGLITETSVGPARSFHTKIPTVIINEDFNPHCECDDILAPQGESTLTSASRIAYVIYTSGSTGAPKGVLVPHRGIVNDIFCVYTEYMRSDPSVIANTLLSTNLCFDAHVDELFLPLAFGGTITCLDVSIAQAPIPAEWGITFMQSTPSVFQVIDIPDSVKCVLIGGEALTKACLSRVMREGRIVINGYGPTETTNESSLHLVSSIDDYRSIGKPIWNTQFYLMDKNGSNLVPRGAWGELYIGGAGVTRGYQNLPDLTKQVFIDNHPLLGPGVVYRTGDIVRITDKGEIEYKGRKDRCGQIKLRGYRIELGEIQFAILNSNPDVKEAHVTVTAVGDGEKQIVAYVAPESIPPLSYGQLAEYMKPAVVVKLKSFPRTISGKLDVKHLPSPVLQLTSAGGDNLASTNPVLAGVMDAVVTTLSLPPATKLSVDSNFFSLGGNSLNLLVLQAKLISHFSISQESLRLQLLLQLQAVGQIAQHIEALTGGTAACPVPDSVLIPLGGATSPSAIPFFCVHAAGGQIHTYTLLASNICESGEARFIGVQDPSLTDGLTHRLNSFEAMGALYAARINAFYPGGTVFIGGHSSGGSIAFETARALESDFGRHVGCVFLIDSECPDRTGPGEATASPEPVKLIERIEEIRHYLYNGWKEGLINDYIAALTAAETSSSAWQLLKAVVPRRQPQSEGWASSDLMQMIGLLSHHLQIEKKYSPFGSKEMGEFDVIRFRPIDGHTSAQADGWRDLTTGRFTVVDVPNANHYTVIRKPAVDILSTVILSTMADLGTGLAARDA